MGCPDTMCMGCDDMARLLSVSAQSPQALWRAKSASGRSRIRWIARAKPPGLRSARPCSPSMAPRAFVPRSACRTTSGRTRHLERVEGSHCCRDRVLSHLSGIGLPEHHPPPDFPARTVPLQCLQAPRRRRAPSPARRRPLRTLGCCIDAARPADNVSGGLLSCDLKPA